MEIRRFIAAGLLVLAASMWSSVAWADPTYPPSNPGVEVLPTTLESSPATEVRGEQVERGNLPFSGQEIAAIAVIGGAALVGGAGMIVLSRRRRGSHT